jgi:hypothetical protein
MCANRGHSALRCIDHVLQSLRQDSNADSLVTPKRRRVSENRLNHLHARHGGVRPSINCASNSTRGDAVPIRIERRIMRQGEFWLMAIGAPPRRPLPAPIKVSAATGAECPRITLRAMLKARNNATSLGDVASNLRSSPRNDDAARHPRQKSEWRNTDAACRSVAFPAGHADRPEAPPRNGQTYARAIERL